MFRRNSQMLNVLQSPVQHLEAASCQSMVVNPVAAAAQTWLCWWYQSAQRRTQLNHLTSPHRRDLYTQTLSAHLLNGHVIQMRSLCGRNLDLLKRSKNRRAVGAAFAAKANWSWFSRSWAPVAVALCSACGIVCQSSTTVCSITRDEGGRKL